MTDPFADLDALQSFFESHHGNATVGFSQSCDDCPVARYLKSLGHVSAWVRCQYYVLGGEILVTRHLPQTVVRFVQLMDQTIHGLERVRARTALRILAEVTQ